MRPNGSGRSVTILLVPRCFAVAGSLPLAVRLVACGSEDEAGVAMDATAITVRVPATSANIGAGFDCLGMALDMFASITVTIGGPEPPPTDDVGEKMVISAMRAVYSAIRTGNAVASEREVRRGHPSGTGPGRERRGAGGRSARGERSGRQAAGRSRLPGRRV